MEDDVEGLCYNRVVTQYHRRVAMGWWCGKDLALMRQVGRVSLLTQVVVREHRKYLITIRRTVTAKLS